MSEDYTLSIASKRTKKRVVESIKPDRIVIEKLFGKYNHEIKLHQDTRVTILVGINGTGKSTILRIIEKVSRGDFVGLSAEPFSKIGIGFGKKYYEFYKTKGGKSIAARYKTTPKSNWSKRFVMSMPQLPTDLYELIEKRTDIRNLLMHERLSKSRSRVYRRMLYDLEHRISNITDFTIDEPTDREIPAWLGEFITGFSCHLISAQRLFKSVDTETYEGPRSYEEFETRRERQVLETIFEYAKSLSEDIREAQRSHSRRALELNQRYLGSVLRSLQEPTKPKEREVYEHEIERIRSLEQKLMSAGLLKETQRIILPETFWARSQEPIIASIIETYIDGTQEMFDVFEKLLNQTTMFSEIVNSHLTEKRIIINAENGISVLLDDGSTLSLDKLSSGEQQYIVLSYGLIFEAAEDGLVLIDEPELSLHAAWLHVFTDDLRRMGESKDLIYLLATHSTVIINDVWDITYELSR